jgi:hypothetical protein
MWYVIGFRSQSYDHELQFVKFYNATISLARFENKT